MKNKHGRKDEIVKLFHHQNGKCYICRQQMTLKLGFDHTATIDHYIPKSHPKQFEGPLAAKNKKAACKKCNEEKGSIHPLLFLAQKAS